jgi:PKD repeat protein
MGYVSGTNTTGVTYSWDFDNNGSFDAGGLGSNTPQHAYSNEGLYTVRLSVSNAVGESATCVRSNYVKALVSNVHYVAHAGAHAYPFTSWATAANDIQSAVNAAMEGGRVMVAAGTYNAVIHCTVAKTVTVHGVEGPSATVIDGADAQRGFWLEAGAHVSGFTITNGYGFGIGSGGGGIYFNTGGTASNCVIAGCGQGGFGGGFKMQSDGLLVDSTVRNCSGGYGAGGYIDVSGTVANCRILDNVAGTHGGGIYIDKDGTVRDSLLQGNEAESQYGGGLFMNYGGLAQRCVIISNRARWLGGGMYVYRAKAENCLIIDNQGGYGGGVGCGDSNGMVKNCTVVSNSSDHGGGVYQGIIVNSVVYDNTAAESNNYLGSALAYSCATPLPGGTGNTAANPQFAGAGDYHLGGASPCVDTGSNPLGTSMDLDGVSRPLDGKNDGTNTVDMGCYEYIHASADSDGDTMLDAWEIAYALDPTNAFDATGNLDGDLHNNIQEFIADTDPNNPNDWFRIEGFDGTSILFDSSDARWYTLLGCTNLVEGVWNPVPGTPPRMGAGGADSMQATNNLPRGFYKLTVELP